MDTPVTETDPQLDTISVKAAGDTTLDVLGAPYGMDKRGQEFTPQTDFGDLPIIPVIYYHGWGVDDGERIGWAYKAQRDNAGQWYRAELDPANPRTQKLIADARAGKVRASSDAISHLVRPAEALKGLGGKIARWVIGALSLMDSATYEHAINPRAIALPAVRAYYEQLFNGLNEETSGEAEAVKAGAVFARRNRDRIQQMKAMLDELLSEFPVDEANSNDPATQGGTKAMEPNTTPEVTPPAVTPPVTPPPAAPVDIHAQVEAAVKAELDKRLVELNRPKFGAPAAKADMSVDELAVKAFSQYLRTGKDDLYEEWAVKAALNEGTTSQGGYLVPTKYSNELVKPLTLGSILRAAGARVIPVDGTNSFKVPTLTNSTKAILTAEATNYNEVEPTVGEVTVTPWKYTKLVKTSEELLADSRIPVEAMVTDDAANAFVLAENDAFTVGAGTTAPQGITVGATQGVTAAGTSAITAEEIIDLYHAVPQQYRDRATWLMKDSTLKLIRKLRENGTTGAFLWQPAISAGQPETILGRPVYTCPDMPAATTGNAAIVFGDLTYYWIFDFGQPFVQRLNELYAATGQIGIRWFRRFDAHVMLATAIQKLVMA